MSRPPVWQKLIDSCLQQEGKPTSYFLQLATLTVSGEASCRTVVFRGWDVTTSKSTPSLLIATDSRSAKVKGLLEYPKAEACWYFRDARVQFRLTTYVSVISSDETNDDLFNLRSRKWRDLSPNAREVYACPPPGRPHEHEFSEEAKAEVANSNEPIEWFAVLMLKPERVDVVDLRANTRSLFELGKDGDWVENSINR